MVSYLTEKELQKIEDLLPESAESGFLELDYDNPFEGGKVTLTGRTEHTESINIPYHRAITLKGER